MIIYFCFEFSSQPDKNGVLRPDIGWNGRHSTQQRVPGQGEA